MRDRRLYISIFLVSSGALAQNYNYGGQGTNYGLNAGGANAAVNYGGNTYGSNASGGNTNSGNAYGTNAAANYGSNATGNYGGNAAANYGGNQYSEGNAADAATNYGGNQYSQGNNYGGNQYSQGNNYGGNQYSEGNNYGGNQYSEDNAAGTNEYGSGNNYETPLINNTTNGANAYGTNSATTNAYGGSTNFANPAATNYAPVNTAVTSETAAATPEALPPGPPVDRDFQFERFGVPGIHIYKLKWPDSNRNVQTIEVYKTDTGDLLQNIVVPQEGLRLVYSELVEPTTTYTNNLRDQIIDTPDYNFDNFADIRLTKEWPYAAGNKMYYIWLYNAETDQYQLSPELSALPAPHANRKKKRIESVTLTGWGGAEYIKNIYTISTEGKLRVDTRITNTMFDREKLWFVRDIRTRVNGELQRVCKFLMRSEGVHKRLWGRRSTCQGYLVKGPPARRGR